MSKDFTLTIITILFMMITMGSGVYFIFLEVLHLDVMTATIFGIATAGAGFMLSPAKNDL